MKKIFLFASALLASLSISAEVITLDLTTAQNLNSDPIAYEAEHTTVSYYNDLKNVMDSTYSANPLYRQIVANEGTFFFDHLPTAQNYGGTSWEGFTVSKMDVDSANQFACVAKGGVAGVGTPFLVGYYSEYAAWVSLDYSPCHVNFSGEFYPKSVQICQNSLTMINLKEGLGTARAFTAEDELTLKIYAIDNEGYNDEDKEPVIYKLAEGTNFNDGWVKIDLTPLGKTFGLNFEMTSTDQSYGFANTALYFAMDELVISTQNPVATFENEVGGINIAKADTCWQGADAPVAGTTYAWQSGDYTFLTYATSWGGFSATTVTNETATTSTGYTQAYRSISGGAYEGNNFAVVYVDSWNPDTISFETQTVNGFFVNNTPYTVGAITTNNFAPASQFKQSDYLTLNCIGLKNKAIVDTVKVDLAIDGKYIGEWTYVDLSVLGEIDAITFTMDGSDVGGYGLNTPSYFAMDNFGANKPAGYVAPDMKEFDVATAITNTNAAVKAVKVIRNGQVVILRGEKAFNVLGAEL